MERKLVFIIAASLMLFSCISVHQKISLNPNYPNRVNANGERVGTWLYYMDEDFDETDDESLAEYYRIITYQNGKPSGTVRDYYKSGVLQWEGILESEYP